ncbi:VOC family protein [Antarcticirhabdus aurantiaca]|uniref:VOC family protein n=1 Tax=Antarcticirhabdus aurantiaca TaxID=2606717 RepID=A0ACD4NMZ2_9HYPH|nr:VOC family protein [Antarcticirhabdus aurantiaca]WAJ28229.1 VOC family protein [Jeongeuplla avenae]
MSFARGIEHVGMTVPTIEEGEAFFAKAFGAEVLYRVLPKSRPAQTGEDIGPVNGLEPGNAQRAISMLRIGTGANLELFEVDHPKGKPAGISTLGPTHFSIYVDDIAAAGQAVVAAGGSMLDGPQDCFQEESGPGNQLWFCRTPWGSLIELIHLPSPMTYVSGATKERFIPEPESGS